MDSWDALRGLRALWQLRAMPVPALRPNSKRRYANDKLRASQSSVTTAGLTLSLRRTLPYGTPGANGILLRVASLRVGHLNFSRQRAQREESTEIFTNELGLRSQS
ncbi:hypothetical protein [Nostoc sp.]